ncbi:MAG: DUF4410 domain-containing protein [Bacteroidales bacterium]|jgi:hypothetical protein|nr:DUF4410 domain-containing protein [Bacteroidales bacterium]MBR6173993.1 DUF4410 domain-containing protein [Bacteroidales bacterium]
MKKTTFTVAIMLLLALGATAQIKVGTYTEWQKTIDELEIKESYDFSNRKTVVILPVQTSDVELPKKSDDNYKLITKALANMTQTIATEMQNQLQKAGYKVIVAEDANFRDPESIVVQFNWTELDLGSRALRVWVGYGAGNARFATQGVIYDGDKEIATFSQRRISALDTQKYEKLVAKGINNVVGDVAKLILAM